MSMEWMDYEEYENEKYEDEKYENEKTEEVSELAENSLKEAGCTLGSGEMTEQELLEEQRRQEQLEKLYDERSDLQRKLNAAKDNLEYSEKALEKVQDSGMDSWISNREYQVKVYTKEVADLEREIWRLDGEIALLE